MTHPMKGRTGLQRILNATGYSIAGLRAAYLGESAFRQEVWLCVVLVPAAFWVGQDWVQTALLAASAGLVLVVELLNSGIEAVVDRISYDHHDLSKRAKDIASAAVFLSLLICGGIWAAALWHRFIA
jgi:diacylglycerol kinase (ATP)